MPLGRRLAAVVLPVVFGALAVAQLDGLHAARRSMRAQGPPLYLPSATTLRVAVLGHRTTGADLLYLWGIQYFGDRVTRRQRPWVAQVYALITDLDPHFRDAYWLGFVSLLVEGRDPSAAFELVDKAIAHNPDYGLIAIEAAITARQLGDDRRAVHYLELAARNTGDPLAQRLLARLREWNTAQEELAEWAALLESEDELTRAIASSHLRDIRAAIDVARLETLVDCHLSDHGERPDRLEVLVDAGYLSELPRDPEGRAYRYDSATGRVSSEKPFRWHPPTRARLGVNVSDLGRCAPASGHRLLGARR